MPTFSIIDIKNTKPILARKLNLYIFINILNFNIFKCPGLNMLAALYTFAICQAQDLQFEQITNVFLSFQKKKKIQI